MKKRFEKTIYVKHEEADGQTYMVADANACSLVGTGEKIKIGVYQLVEVQDAEGVVKFTKPR